jgi:Tol biopolymer transport system component
MNSPSKANSSVYQVPTLGGTSRTLIETADSGVTFSPDAKELAYTVLDPIAGESRIMIANADGSGGRVLAAEKSTSLLANLQGVHWSPDGKRLAALRKSLNSPDRMLAQLVEIDVSSGKIRPLPGRRWRDVIDFVWLPDGSGFLLAAMDKTGLPTQLWTVTYPGGELRRISNDLSYYNSVDISADGKSIVSAQQNQNSSIWVGPASAPDSARQITTGRMDGYSGLAFTADNRIVYGANHADNWDLFMVDSDGKNEHQLSFDQWFHEMPAMCETAKSRCTTRISAAGVICGNWI